MYMWSVSWCILVPLTVESLCQYGSPSHKDNSQNPNDLTIAPGTRATLNQYSHITSGWVKPKKIHGHDIHIEFRRFHTLPGSRKSLKYQPSSHSKHISTIIPPKTRIRSLINTIYTRTHSFAKQLLMQNYEKKGRHDQTTNVIFLPSSWASWVNFSHPGFPKIQPPPEPSQRSDKSSKQSLG